MEPIPEKDLRRLFEGILRGNGDVFSRMASSHEGGENSYPFPINGIVNNLNEMALTETLSDDEIQSQVNIAITQVKAFLDLASKITNPDEI